MKKGSSNRRSFFCGADAGITPQAGAITDLGIENMTSGKGFVLLDVLDDFERHKIVAAPRNVRERFVNDCRHNVNFLTEYCSRVDGKRGAGIVVRKRFDGVEIKVGKR